MKKQVFGILATWSLAIAWHLRYRQYRSGSPIPGSFGANIDWTRHHIVQTGRIQSIQDPWTLPSSFAGTQNYDYGSIFYAILNIVAGKTTLVAELTILNQYFVFGLIVFPMIFVYWTFTVSKKPPNYTNLLLIVVLALLPTQVTITSSSNGWWTELYAISVILLTFIIYAKCYTSSRHKLLFIILSYIMMNVYHTFVFLFLAIFGGIFIFQMAQDKIVTTNSATTYAYLFPVTILLFYLVGIFINGRLNELITSMRTILLVGSHDIYSATGSGLISSAGNSEIFNINYRRVFKILNYISALLLIVEFNLSTLKESIKNNRCSQYSTNFRYSKFLFAAILSFPFIFVSFYAVGGLGSAIGRTVYIGVYFAIFSVGILLQSQNRWLKHTTTVLVIIMIISAVPAAILSGLFVPPHSFEEEQTITHAGSTIPKDSYVFSDTSIGLPLLYYNIKGISTVQVTHENWEERLRAIYYNNSTDEGISEMKSTIFDSSVFVLGDSATQPDKFYFIIRKSASKKGVNLFSYRTRPTPQDPRQKYMKMEDVDKIYESGGSSIFLSKK